MWGLLIRSWSAVDVNMYTQTQSSLHTKAGGSKSSSTLRLPASISRPVLSDCSAWNVGSTSDGSADVFCSKPTQDPRPGHACLVCWGRVPGRRDGAVAIGAP